MEFSENQAIYLQIANYFFEQILSRKWKNEERIPSVREVAVNFEVNPNTVMRTYNFLQEREIIFNKRGIGYFVTEGAFEKVLEIKKHEFIRIDLPKVFRTMELLGMNISDLQTIYSVHKL
jgi:GntR family transcriptional regulator